MQILEESYGLSLCLDCQIGQSRARRQPKLLDFESQVPRESDKERSVEIVKFVGTPTARDHVEFPTREV